MLRVGHRPALDFELTKRISYGAFLEYPGENLQCYNEATSYFIL